MFRDSWQKRNDHTSSYSAQGFSIIEILFVVAILGIITTFVLMGSTRARASFQLSSNGDILKAYLEKAFTDARRRHALGTDRTQVTVTGLNTYQVFIDLDGEGTPETRTIALTDRVKFVYDPLSPPTATIDWRGNVAESNVNFQLQSTTNELLTLNLTSSGDTSDDARPAMPVITATTTSADVKTTVVVNGNSAPNPNKSPTPTPTPLSVCTGSQLPGTNNCCCAPGKTIDDKGKCK